MRHFTDVITRKMDIVPQNSNLRIGKFHVSIQASSYHYCTPKQDLEDLNQYSSFAVMIYHEKNGKIVPWHWKRSKRLKETRFFSDLLGWAIGDSSDADFGFVHRSIVQELCEWLFEIQGLIDEWDKQFPVTSVSKQEIYDHFDNSDDHDSDKVKKVLDKLTDAEMQKFAENLENDYLEQLFWSSLDIIFESMFLKESEE